MLNHMWMKKGHHSDPWGTNYAMHASMQQRHTYIICSISSRIRKQGRRSPLFCYGRLLIVGLLLRTAYASALHYWPCMHACVARDGTCVRACMCSMDGWMDLTHITWRPAAARSGASTSRDSVARRHRIASESDGCVHRRWAHGYALLFVGDPLLCSASVTNLLI